MQIPIIIPIIQKFLLANKPSRNEERKMRPIVTPVSFQLGLESIQPIVSPTATERTIKSQNLFSDSIILKNLCYYTIRKIT